MARRIILLTGEREVPFFRDYLKARAPAIDVEAAFNVGDLDTLTQKATASTRILAFLTDTIVPRGILERLSLTSYNIHPGPPTYPGSHPEAFALWDDASSFGVTAHEMAARVDEGAIVATSFFDIPPNCARLELGDLTYARAVEMFAFIADHCATSDAALPANGDVWSGEKRTKKQLRQLIASIPLAAPGTLSKLQRVLGPDYRDYAA